MNGTGARVAGAARRGAAYGALLGALACQESLTAPGVCPDYCPTTEIAVHDTVVLAAVTRDSSYRGYRSSWQATRVQVTSAGDLLSHAVVRFIRFTPEFYGDDGSVLAIVSTDSFVVSLPVQARSVGDSTLALAVYRLPADIDTLSSLAALAPFFDDSMLLGTVRIPDSLVSDTVSLVVGSEGFPTLVEDSLVAAIGVAIRSDSAAFVELGTREGSEWSRLARYVTVKVGDSTEVRTDARDAYLDGSVAADLAAAPAEALVVGGLPSARSILRLVLPDAIVDSSDVVRATLILPLADTVRGAVGDTLWLRADGLLADVGGKSPFVPPDPRDTRGLVGVPVGSGDPIRLDITSLIRAWRGNEKNPRSLMLWLRDEAQAPVELRLWSSRNAAAAPSIWLTYVPLPGEGG